MSLLKYLHHEEAKPSWYACNTLASLITWTILPRIRATYTTRSHQYKLDPVFLNSHDPPAGVKSENAQFPHILLVTPQNFTPSLLPSELEKIDNLFARGGKSPSIPTSLREEVTGSKETRPHVSAAWKQRNPRQCAYCEKHGEKSLSVCSRCVTYSFLSLAWSPSNISVFRCKLVQYCGPEWFVDSSSLV